MSDELAQRRAQRAERQEHARRQGVLDLAAVLTGKNYVLQGDRVIIAPVTGHQQAAHAPRMRQLQVAP